MEKLEALFQSPPAQWRGKPFWSWNGKLEKDELLRQIEVFHQMGMGGYFCHSRIGLETPYLGDEWFDLIRACAQKGQSLGMETWLYDEDRWPSGIAGGKVTKNPENRMKFLRLSILSQLPKDWSRVLAAFTVRLEGNSFWEKHRVYQGEQTDGKTVLLFTWEEMVSETSCNGYTYLDTMKRSATECFLEETHEKYRAHCGDQLGREIFGIFTDEPHRGALMAGFNNSNPDSAFLVPYTELLFDEFLAAFGYDLRDFLPELFLWPDGEQVSPVKWQYTELTERLFLKNFMAPIHSWCQKNNLRFTGHLLHEDSLTTQTCMIGSIMRAYEHMDVPGVDVLMEHNYCFWIVKQLQSAARQLGKPWMLSELYGGTGWQFDFEGHKAVGDWQALFGINLRCHHLSWYSMQGEGKRDYPASISFQSAWYPYYSLIENYFGRLHLLLSQGEPVCDLLVLNPVESLWCRIYPRWSWQLQTLDPVVQQLEKIYTDTFHALCSAKIDFDYGDEDFLARMGGVEEENGHVVLRVGKSAYRRVLVTGMLTMRSTTLALLNEFLAKGGQVIFSGDPPKYVDAAPSDMASHLAATYTQQEQMVQALGEKPLICVRDGDGNEISDIYAQVRRDGTQYVAVLMNTNRLQAFRQVTVTVTLSGYCECWDARTGNRTLLTKGNPITFETDFEAVGELCLIITQEDHHLLPTAVYAKELQQIPCGDCFSYQLEEPNVCVLQFVDYQIDQQPPVCNLDVLEADQAIRDQLSLPRRGGAMLQPWFVGHVDVPPVCDLRLTYHFRIDAMPNKLQLAVETPDEFVIQVNGQQDALQATDGFWVDRCFHLFTLDPKALVMGENVITLSCRFRNDLNLEAIYLLGEFGVSLSSAGVCLTRLPQKLAVGDITQQGLPFYGAGIRYLLDIPENLQGDVWLQTENFEGALLVATNGTEHSEIWCQPYRARITPLLASGKQVALCDILTRTNTFGMCCGPDGQNGSVYHPRPQGLVSPVWLRCENKPNQSTSPANL